MTTIHTRQLQQYTQDNYNNTHKTTTTIHTRQLQQYTQDNYNNTHKATTTIHTIQLQQCTQDNYNNTHKTTTKIHTVNQQQLYTRQLKTSNNTHDTNYNTTCTEGKNSQARQYCVQFIVILIVGRPAVSLQRIASSVTWESIDTDTHLQAPAFLDLSSACHSQESSTAFTTRQMALSLRH